MVQGENDGGYGQFKSEIILTLYINRNRHEKDMPAGENPAVL